MQIEELSKFLDPHLLLLLVEDSKCKNQIIKQISGHKSEREVLNLYNQQKYQEALKLVPKNDLWMNLSLAILLKKDTLEWVLKINQEIQANKTDDTNQRNQATWLICWSLFSCFQSKRAEYSQLYESPLFMNTIQTNCEFVLKYTSALMILKKQKSFDGYLQIIKNSSHSDCIQEFLLSLLDEFDFQKTTIKFKEALELLKTDYFMKSVLEEFTSCCRVLMFEVFSKVHSKCSFEKWSQYLGVGMDKIEKTLGELVKSSGVDGKIDPKTVFLH